MSVSIDDVKRLREITGISMMACKKALEDASGNIDVAVEALRKKGMAKAAEKSERTTTQGIVISYVHTNFKVGAMVQIACETDFVAKNEAFIQFAQDIAMHIVAANPLTVKPDDVDASFIEKEKEIWAAQLANEGKKPEMIPMIIENKANKFRDENSLLKQIHIKDGERTVEQVLLETINRMGENIKIEKFVRYSI